MTFRVKCIHCEATLDVADKYHYHCIDCPSCGKEIEAVTDDTLRVTREFIEEVGGDGADTGVTEVAPGVFHLEEPE